MLERRGGEVASWAWLEPWDRGGVNRPKPDSLISPDGNPRCMMYYCMEISGSLRLLSPEMYQWLPAGAHQGGDAWHRQRLCFGSRRQDALAKKDVIC